MGATLALGALTLQLMAHRRAQIVALDTPRPDWVSPRATSALLDTSVHLLMMALVAALCATRLSRSRWLVMARHALA